MTLDMAKKGQKIFIKKINDEKIKVQAIRLGIYEGAKVDCSLKIPFGPVILSNRMQEIAVGRTLARKIEIDVIKEGA
ncbi:MAG: ferrous iron transport protein A [Caloramator sp.]|nr:ferrous iron transport protein A [Caloramator sp.]